MVTSRNTPLWLNLKKEYIDDNFEQLLIYLKDIGTNRDSFYDTTIDLLNQRVGILLDDLSHHPLFDDENKSEDTLFNVRLLAAWILVNSNSKDVRKAFVGMLGEIRKLAPKFSEELLQTSIECLKHEAITSLGFSWIDILNFKSELFAYKTTANTTFYKPLTKPSWCFGKGCIYIDSDGICSVPSNRENALKMINSGSSSLELNYGLSVKTDSGEKLKQSKKHDLVSIGDFTTDFLSSLNHIKTSSSLAKKLYHYSDDAQVDVRITRIAGEEISVETTDPKYSKISGTIVFSMKSILYYYANMFSWYLRVGDIIPVQIVDAEKGTFSLNNTFVKFIVEDCRQDYTGEFTALLIDKTQPHYDVWLTERGTPIYMKKSDDHSKGDIGFIEIDSFSTGKYYGIINGHVNDIADDGTPFDENEIRRDCLRAFTKEIKVTQSTKEQESHLNPDVIRLLIRQLFAHQKHLLKPSDRAVLLSHARIMSEIIGEDAASESITFAYTYLRALILFVRDEPLEKVHLTLPAEFADAPTAKLRKDVVELLKLWGKNTDDKLLSDTATDTTLSPMLNRLAKLIQTSNSMREIVTGASLNVLKREIIKTLSIETENESDLEADDKIYIGIESGSMEFKESVCFPANNNMQPDEQKQIRNVLRGVCAFLNSTTGGTLYIGVTDQGYVKGIQGDMDFLHIDNLDTYMRYHIQDPAKTLLGLEILPNLRLEPMYDNQVIAIHVEPYPYHIVELEGKAYIRVNAESREMTDSVRQQLIDRKILTNREKAANLSALLQAKQNKRQVILHNYSSSNSGKISDRRVEAYNVEPDHNLLMCLDLKDWKCKVFNINRIGYVEILDTEWVHKALHKAISVDHFHMSGEKKIHCVLQLDLMARNLLKEEYPTAVKDLSPSDDNNIWYFDTEVYRMEGIGRFYVGLANHIKILDAPELLEYSKQFVKDNIG